MRIFDDDEDGWLYRLAGADEPETEEQRRARFICGYCQQPVEVSGIPHAECVARERARVDKIIRDAKARK